MEPIDFFCSYCKHFLRYEDGGCEAFPEGIPWEIFTNGERHSEPLKNQNNNLVFTPIDKGKESHQI